MVGWNKCRHGGEVVELLSQSLWEQVDAALRLVGRYRGLSLAQRFAYDHSSNTMYSSLYTLVDYAAERVGAGGTSSTKYRSWRCDSDSEFELTGYHVTNVRVSASIIEVLLFEAFSIVYYYYYHYTLLRCFSHFSVPLSFFICRKVVRESSFERKYMYSALRVA